MGPDWKVSTISNDEIKANEADKLMKKDKKLSFDDAFYKCG